MLGGELLASAFLDQLKSIPATGNENLFEEYEETAEHVAAIGKEVFTTEETVPVRRRRTHLVGPKKNVAVFDDGLARGHMTVAKDDVKCSVNSTLRAAATTTESKRRKKDDNPRAAAEPSSSFTAPSVDLNIGFLDGSSVLVTARTDDAASSVLAAAALAIGVGAEALACLSLYAVDDGPEHRIPPLTLAGALDYVGARTNYSILLAVRLFTPRLLRAARRGFHQRAAAPDFAIARLLYAQAVASVMACDIPLPALFPQQDNEDEDDPYAAFLRERPSSSSTPLLSPLAAAASHHQTQQQQQNRDFGAYDSEDDVPMGGLLSTVSTTGTPSESNMAARSSSSSFSLSAAAAAEKVVAAEDVDPAIASAVRLGALRLWSRAGDIVDDEHGIISAAVQLINDHGVDPFVPELQSHNKQRQSFDEKDDDDPDEVIDWEGRLLGELDYLLKIQLRHATQLSSLAADATVSESDGITIEVFEVPAETKSEEDDSGRTSPPTHTIHVQREPEDTPPASERKKLVTTQGAAFSLHGAAAFFRLVTSSEMYGSTLFACAAQRRAPTDADDRTVPTSQPESPDRGFFAALVPRTQANRLLGISRKGLVVRSGTDLGVVQSIGFTKLRRWICDADAKLVRVESEEPYDHFREYRPSRHQRINERLADRTRRNLRRSLRSSRPRSLPPPKLGARHRSDAGPASATTAAAVAASKASSSPRRTNSSRNLMSMVSSTSDDDKSSQQQQQQQSTWSWRTLFANSAPTKSIGEKIHEALAEPESLDDEDEGASSEKNPNDVEDDHVAVEDSRLLQRVIFELHLESSLGTGALGGRQATEVVALLDDYGQIDLADERPRCRYESAFAPAPVLAKSPPPRREKLSPAAGGPPPTPTPPPPSRTPSDDALGGKPTVYKALVSAVVRPPRFVYDAKLLGPSSFDFAGRRILRSDFVLRNKDGHRLHCSHWRPVGPSCGGDGGLHTALNFKTPTSSPKASSSSKAPITTNTKTPVVVFMHANSASRVQACTYLAVVLSLGFSMFAFDCCGSGISDGDYVTLGWREAYDLLVVVAHLKSQPDVGPVAVWGHSMGAASVIYYQAFSQGNWPALDACVLDSPYSDFAVLARHLVSSNAMLTGTNLTQYLSTFTLAQTALQLVLDSIDSSVQKIVGVSPLVDLSPVSRVHLCTAPALFLQARNDRIISMQHVEELANKYAGPRKLAIIDGTHSSPRNGAARKFVALYLKKHIKLSPDQRVPSTRNVVLEALPWARQRSNAPFAQ